MKNSYLSPGFAGESLPVQEVAFTVMPGQVLKALLCLIALLLTASASGMIMLHAFGWDNRFVNVFANFFNVALENNAPTLFSFILLVAAAALNFVIAGILRQRIPTDRTRYHWLVIGSLFLFLSLDETLQLHELFNREHSTDSRAGVLYYTWVIPYSAFALSAAFFFKRFLFGLPRRTARLFLTSGLLYAGGAIGFELAEGYSVERLGVGNVYDLVLCTLEEGCEMLGVTLFIYGLLDYLLRLRVRFLLSKRRGVQLMTQS